MAHTLDTLMDGDMAFLCAPLNFEELESMLTRILGDKAPCLDGITVETLRVCWSFIGTNFLAMVLTF